MEQCTPFGWVYYNEEEGIMGELRQYIMQSRMELEATIIAAQEEIMKKDEELLNIKDLLMLAIKERDESQSTLQNLTLEKLLIQQQLHQTPVSHIPNTTNPNHTTNNYCLNHSSSSSNHSDQELNTIISSPNSPVTPPPFNHRPLPEKGQLLKAVMEAGPLLQTLLLAGPLPQWQHPPPQLDSIEIPQVTINPNSSSNFSPNMKRGVDNFDFDCSMVSSSPKYQRVG